MSKLNALTFFLEETIFQHTPFLVSLLFAGNTVEDLPESLDFSWLYDTSQTRSENGLFDVHSSSTSWIPRFQHNWIALTTFVKNNSKDLANGILPSPVFFLSLDVYSHYLNAGYMYKREKRAKNSRTPRSNDYKNYQIVEKKIHREYNIK